jgi:hypothetical protein
VSFTLQVPLSHIKKAISLNEIEGCVGLAIGLDPMQIKKNLLSLSLVAHPSQRINLAIMILYFNTLCGFISLIWVYKAQTLPLIETGEQKLKLE